MGKPSEDYPWHWSVYTWIEGESALYATVNNTCDVAKTLADFLKALRGLAAGDPACDLAIAWTYFKGESRTVFFDQLPLDNDT